MFCSDAQFPLSIIIMQIFFLDIVIVHVCSVYFTRQKGNLKILDKRTNNHMRTIISFLYSNRVVDVAKMFFFRKH